MSMCACDRSARVILKQKPRTSSSSFILFHFISLFFFFRFAVMSSLFVVFGWLDQTQLYFYFYILRKRACVCVHRYIPSFWVFFSLRSFHHGWRQTTGAMGSHFYFNLFDFYLLLFEAHELAHKVHPSHSKSIRSGRIQSVIMIHRSPGLYFTYASAIARINLYLILIFK